MDKEKIINEKNKMTQTLRKGKKILKRLQPWRRRREREKKNSMNIFK